MHILKSLSCPALSLISPLDLIYLFSTHIITNNGARREQSRLACTCGTVLSSLGLKLYLSTLSVFLFSWVSTMGMYTFFLCFIDCVCLSLPNLICKHSVFPGKPIWVMVYLEVQKFYFVFSQKWICSYFVFISNSW